MNIEQILIQHAGSDVAGWDGTGRWLGKPTLQLLSWHESVIRFERDFVFDALSSLEVAAVGQGAFWGPYGRRGLVWRNSYFFLSDPVHLRERLLDQPGESESATCVLF